MECLLDVNDFAPDSESGSIVKSIASKVLLTVFGQICSVGLCTGWWLSAAARLYKSIRIPKLKACETWQTQNAETLQAQLA
jgi:hypothetical protein